MSSTTITAVYTHMCLHAPIHIHACTYMSPFTVALMYMMYIMYTEIKELIRRLVPEDHFSLSLRRHRLPVPHLLGIKPGAISLSSVCTISIFFNDSISFYALTFLSGSFLQIENLSVHVSP